MTRQTKVIRETDHVIVHINHDTQEWELEEKVYYQKA
jgi:hypothetical protein